MNYYYLVSSLPMLAMDAPPPFSIEDFQATCAQHLSEADFAGLCQLLENDDSGTAKHAFVSEWRDRKTQLQNALASGRASRLGVDPLPFIRPHGGFQVMIDKSVAEVFSRENPLEREQMLDRLRWNQIDELVQNDMFGPRTVFAYALKLRIVERWAAMDEERGKERTDEIVTRKPADASNQN